MSAIEKQKERLIKEVTAETEMLGQRRWMLRLDLSMAVALEVIGSMQLAMRHPKMVPEQRERLRKFIQEMIDEIPADCPALKRIVMLGFEQSFDE